MYRIFYGSIMILVALGLTLTMTLRFFAQAQESQEQVSRYDNILERSRELASIRNNLIEQYENIDPALRARLERMLPRNIDTVRLTIEIEAIAARHGLIPSGLSFSEHNTSHNGYSSVEMSFSVDASYENFISLLSDLENNLRLSDINSVSFTVTEDRPTTYSVRFTTYWLGS